MLAASCVFQVILPGTMAVSPGLLSVCGIMENVQKLLGVFSGLVEQGNILGITDIRRCEAYPDVPAGVWSEIFQGTVCHLWH